MHPALRRLVVAAISLAAVATATAENGPDPAPALQRIRDRVAEISANRSPDEVRHAIADWKEREPQSATPYIVAANYEYSLAQQQTAIALVATKNGRSPKGMREGQFSIKDQKTGKEVGVLGEVPVGPKPDATSARNQKLRGAAELEAALQKFPARLDIMIGRAIMLEDAQAWKPLEAQIEAALAQSAKNPDALRWLDDELPPSPPKTEVTAKLQSFFGHAFREESNAGRERATRFAQLGLKYFPEHVPFLSDLGAVYASQEQPQKAVELFEKARLLAPDDSIVLGNLARTQLDLDQLQAAQQTAAEIIRIDNDPEAVRVARSILAEVEKKSRR